MAKNLISGLIFTLWPKFKSYFFLRVLLDVRHCYKLLLYAISRKTYDQNSKKNGHFGPDLSPLGPNSDCHFLKKNLTSSVTRYHGQLSSCKILEKTNDSILRKFSDRWMDQQQTDRLRDEQDWFHRMLSDWRRASNRRKFRNCNLHLIFSFNNDKLNTCDIFKLQKTMN